jgi:RNA polymerase sigma factor (sigma-70 family)
MSAIRPMPSPQANSDDELMRQLAAGRQESLGRLHRRYAPLVFITAAHSLDRGAAEEVVQDVFVAVWRNAAVFTPKRGAFRPWLLQIAHFRILNELRRRRRRPRLLPDADDLFLASLPDVGPEPEELAWRESLRPVMRSACQGLPPSQRQAVDLAFFQGLSHQEVAAELRVPLGTVKTRIRTGLRTLRGKLATKVNAERDGCAA